MFKCMLHAAAGFLCHGGLLNLLLQVSVVLNGYVLKVRVLPLSIGRPRLKQASSY